MANGEGISGAAITAEAHRRISAAEARIDKLDVRVTAQELWRARIEGALAILTVFAALPTVVMAYIVLSEKLVGG